MSKPVEPVVTPPQFVGITAKPNKQADCEPTILAIAADGQIWEFYYGSLRWTKIIDGPKGNK